MPLYEYKCESCSHRFERIQKFSDPPVSTCPQCGGQVRKLLSSPAIQFKGSGWYITDYARKDSKGDPSKKPSKDEGGKSDSKEASSSDAKPSGSDTATQTPSAPASKSDSPTTSKKSSD